MPKREVQRDKEPESAVSPLIQKTLDDKSIHGHSLFQASYRRGLGYKLQTYLQDDVGQSDER